MASNLTIRAKLNETTDADGYLSIPESVTITGAGFLAPSALADIAQKVLEDYIGEDSDYNTIYPDWRDISDETVVKIVNRKG